MPFEPVGDLLAPQDFVYGKTGYGKVIGGTAAVAGAVAFAIPCGNLTGKKRIYTFVSANAMTWTIYGSLDPVAVQATLETDAIAGTVSSLEIAQAGVVLTSGGTESNAFTTTEPWTWLIAVAIRSGGSDATYNAFMAGN